MLREETLIDYLEGRLPERKYFEVERHLSGCDQCLSELLLLSEVLSDSTLDHFEAVPGRVKQKTIQQVMRDKGGISRIWEKVMRGCRRHIGSDFFFGLPGWRLHFTKVRGSQVAVDREYYATKKSFPDIEVKIEFDRTAVKKGDIRVTALSNPTNAELLRVTLRKADREVSSFLFAKSPAIFEDVDFGRYELLFSLNGETKGTYSFEIRETRNAT